MCGSQFVDPPTCRSHHSQQQQQQQQARIINSDSDAAKQALKPIILAGIDGT
jgi:hypothetical protein